MFDVKSLMDQYLGGAAGTAEQPKGNSDRAGNFGGLAGGALAGGLVGLLAGTKTGRKVGKNALAYGGTAVLGGLAYKAWRDWQGGKAAPPAPDQSVTPALSLPPEGSAFLPQPGDQNTLNRALIRAMVGAAKADGEIDAQEQQRIFQQVEQLNLDDELRDFLGAELRAPLDLNAIVADATCPETAAEIYAASLIAVDSQAPAEQGYLAMLAARLKLEPDLVKHLHANVNQAIV